MLARASLIGNTVSPHYRLRFFSFTLYLSHVCVSTRSPLPSVALSLALSFLHCCLVWCLSGSLFQLIVKLFNYRVTIRSLSAISPALPDRFTQTPRSRLFLHGCGLLLYFYLDCINYNVHWEVWNIIIRKNYFWNINFK